jgi:antitoxin component YwqK of YwqJK toxin-antitoxin module
MGSCASVQALNDSVVIETPKEKYPSDKEHVFKSCSREWIVILEKLEDTHTNENRCDIVDPLYAKFRANKLKVVNIIHKFKNQEIDKIQNSVYSDKKITYKKGEVIEDENFNVNIENVCAPGIHYFKSKEAAFYYEIPDNYTGRYNQWYQNGQRYIECVFKNGKLDGLYKEWHGNGQLKIICMYEDGNLDGFYKKWYSNGKLYIYCKYKNRALDGKYEEWLPNGRLKKQCGYINGCLWSPPPGGISYEEFISIFNE